MMDVYCFRDPRNLDIIYEVCILQEYKESSDYQKNKIYRYQDGYKIECRLFGKRSAQFTKSTWAVLEMFLCGFQYGKSGGKTETIEEREEGKKRKAIENLKAVQSKIRIGSVRGACSLIRKVLRVDKDEQNAGVFIATKDPGDFIFWKLPFESSVEKKDLVWNIELTEDEFEETRNSSKDQQGPVTVFLDKKISKLFKRVRNGSARRVCLWVFFVFLFLVFDPSLFVEISSGKLFEYENVTEPITETIVGILEFTDAETLKKDPTAPRVKVKLIDETHPGYPYMINKFEKSKHPEKYFKVIIGKIYKHQDNPNDEILLGQILKRRLQQLDTEYGLDYEVVHFPYMEIANQKDAKEVLMKEDAQLIVWGDFFERGSPSKNPSKMILHWMQMNTTPSIFDFYFGFYDEKERVVHGEFFNPEDVVEDGLAVGEIESFAHFLIARNYFNNGHPQESLDELMKIPEENRNIYTLVYEIMCRFELGKTIPSKIERLYKMRPRISVCALWMGIICGERGDYEMALNYLFQALFNSSKTRSIRSAIFYNMAQAYFFLGKYREANGVLKSFENEFQKLCNKEQSKLDKIEYKFRLEVLQGNTTDLEYLVLHHGEYYQYNYVFNRLFLWYVIYRIHPDFCVPENIFKWIQKNESVLEECFHDWVVCDTYENKSVLQFILSEKEFVPIN